MGWIALAIVVAVLLVGVALFYNRFVSLRQQVRAAYSDVDVQLKRRHDLIPNLIETVKGYAAHERGVFDEVTKARADAIAAGAEPPAERATAETALSMSQVRGNLGVQFRTSEQASSALNELRRAQAEAEVRCF